MIQKLVCQDFLQRGLIAPQAALSQFPIYYDRAANIEGRDPGKVFPFEKQLSVIMAPPAMNSRDHKTTDIVFKFAPAAVWGGICLAILLAPLLEAAGRHAAAGLLYQLFAPVCHQDPGRSFALGGHPWAACHRCAGIYFGLFFLSWLPPEAFMRPRMQARRRVWVVAGALPLMFDSLLDLAGIWPNTASSRFLTGLIFGAMVSVLLGAALRDLRLQGLGNRGCAQAQGGLS